MSRDPKQHRKRWRTEIRIALRLCDSAELGGNADCHEILFQSLQVAIDACSS